MLDRSQNNITHELSSLQKDLFDLSARNRLLQIDPTRLWVLTDKDNLNLAEKIYNKAAFFEKEYALKTVLLVDLFLKWQHPKTGVIYTSPLVYRSATIIKKTRESQSFSAETEETTYTVNPILRKLFLEEFQLKLPEHTHETESLVTLLLNEFTQIQLTFNFTTEGFWQIITLPCAGIFNYRKLLLVKDYEIIFSHPGMTLKALFGEASKTSEKKLTNPYAPLLDKSQQDAVNTALQSHTVIQGPPGTGKSHVLSNFIKACLLANKKVLFVSEKRAALDVVFQKLKTDKLALRVAYFNGEKNEKKSFYAHLKKSWENASKSDSYNTHLSPSKPLFHDLLDFYPTQLIRTASEGEPSIADLEEQLLAIGKTRNEIQLQGIIPTYQVWQQYLEMLVQVETAITRHFKVPLLQDLTLCQLNAAIFSEKDPIQKLQNYLVQTNQPFVKVTDLCERYHLQQNMSDLVRLSLAASVMNMVNKNQLDLLRPDHKKYRAFTQLAKKFQLTQHKLNKAQQLTQKWSKKPSVSEITELTDLLKQKKKPDSLLARLKRGSVKQHTFFEPFSPDLSTVAKLQLLEEVRTEWHLTNQLDELRIKLKHELSIAHPETEIDHILQVRTKLQTIQSNHYQHILEHPNSITFIQDLTHLHTALNQLINLLNFIGIYDPEKTVQENQQLVLKLQHEISGLEQFTENLLFWYYLPHAIREFITRNKHAIQPLDCALIQHHLRAQTRFEPNYKNLSGNELLRAHRKRSQAIALYVQNLDIEINHNATASIQKMERLAEMPSARLNENDRATRKKHKESKRLLVHELVKKQRHLPVRDLLENCHDLITSLQPVWMMNPLSVSSYLPCMPDLFDVIVFDEASQIPLEDSIPAIYRAKHLVVAGDAQQMPPAKFFTSNPHGKTLLDQASFYLAQKSLTHHYRSDHPALISFSNTHFYDNNLISNPPATSDYPIIFHKTLGTFQDQRNVEEAREIAKYYLELLASGIKDVGILSFSREQQHEIEKQIHALKLPANDQLLIRNLENIQGNEKAYILISVGYGKNTADYFRKNFGPLNQEGGSKRLNVMISRAIRKMIIFSSITAGDIGLSENRGTAMLADFLMFAENPKPFSLFRSPTSIAEKLIFDLLAQRKIAFQYVSKDAGLHTSAFLTDTTKKILLINPGLDDGQALASILRPIEEKFKAIMILTTTDLLRHRTETENAILDFFA